MAPLDHSRDDAAVGMRRDLSRVKGLVMSEASQHRDRADTEAALLVRVAARHDDCRYVKNLGEEPESVVSADRWKVVVQCEKMVSLIHLFRISVECLLERSDLPFHFVPPKLARAEFWPCALFHEHGEPNLRLGI